MDISSIRADSRSAAFTQPQPSPEEAAQRREVAKAVHTINNSGTYGENNQLEYSVDRATHRLITKVVDRTTKEVIMQIPPGYVIELAHALDRAAAKGTPGEDEANLMTSPTEPSFLDEVLLG